MSTPGRRAAITTAVLVAALVAAWLVPALAPVLAWPFLLFVPGWSALSLVMARIDAAGRIGLAVVISVAVSTHLVYWLSHLAGGYGRGVIFASLAILAIPTVVAAWRQPAGIGSVLRGVRPALLVAVPAMVVVGAALGIGLWKVTPFGVNSGGSNWSDLGVHLSIAETLNAGANFPPEVPYFAGVPLVYHWFADFHAAILAEAAGAFSIPAMVVQSTVLAGALALLVYSLVRRIVRGGRARRVGILAAALVIFGGGLGYIRLIGDVANGLGNPIELVATTSYDNQWLTEWPYFRIPSVMGTGLLAHRATTAGLPMLVGAMLLLIAGLPTARQRAAGWRDRRWLLGGAGLLGALLAPFHFFLFPVVPLLALFWVLAGGRLVDREAVRNAAAFIGPYLLALPFLLAPVLQASGSGALQLVPGWASAPRDDGLAAVVFFYVTNLGVPFALALVAAFVSGVPRRGFLVAWVVALFLVPNLAQFSIVDFDMNKYFQAMWIAVAILAAWLIRLWPAVAVVAVLLLSVPSPLLVAAWTGSANLQVLSTADLRAARWVAANTPADAVFVTDGWVSSLTDPAGRKRLTTFGAYIANLGYRPDERIADVTTIYCGGDPDLAAELMSRHGATYLVDGGRPIPCPAPTDFGSSDAFELVYDTGPLIWRLAEG